MQNLKTELQAYLDKAYPGADIERADTVFGQVHIRFELGGELSNGSRERVMQATDRATILFKETFPDPANDLWLLIYDFAPDKGNTFLYTLFGKVFCYDKLEENETDETVENELGQSVREKIPVRLTIMRLPNDAIKTGYILNGIANNEMGFKPAISQSVIFLDEATDRAFLMYDDRGCYVWSNEADKIRELYMHRNDWIVDYHRPEIDQYFVQD